MQLDNLKIYIDRHPASMELKIFVVNENGVYRDFYSVNSESGHVLFTRYEDKDYFDKEPKPFLVMPHKLASAFLDAVVEFANGKGYKTESENLISGKLQATETHLKDMRDIADKLINHITK